MCEREREREIKLRIEISRIVVIKRIRKGRKGDRYIDTYLDK